MSVKVGNSSKVNLTNCIIANTVGVLSHAAANIQPECTNNNYFEAPNYLSATSNNAIPDAKYDTSSSATQLDPGFVDAAAGDFTVTNINVKGGDPRWKR
jgi:hypothetical protein